MAGVSGMSALQVQPFGGLAPFDFDPDAVVWSDDMAKRATSVFAAAPIVQGHFDGSGVPDILSFVRGNQMHGTWYDNFDPNQGTAVLWWTPEKDRDAGQANDEYLLYMISNGYVRYEHDAQRIVFRMNASMTDAMTTVAGTPYALGCRWNSVNSLDGTNYQCVSVDNVHTFATATSFAIAAPLATMAIGSSAGTTNPANAILEGVTFFRRTLFDGTYGVSMQYDATGPIDEIAAIYAAGAGADPCLVNNGSWDVTFCLPTDAAPGALVTGVGEAWSHPHSSNVIPHGWAEDGFYGGGDWAVVFNGTNTEIDCGNHATTDDLHDAAMTVEFWLWWDGTTGYRYISTKTALGWRFLLNGTAARIEGYINCATTNGVSWSSTGSVPVRKWVHIAFTWDDAAYATPRLWINGVEDTVVGSARNGVIVTDAGTNLIIGYYTAAHFGGVLGWGRLSDNIRYAADFIPPRTLPGNDGNTVAIWGMADGTGVTIDNTGGPAPQANRDGALANGTWEEQWNQLNSPPEFRGVEYNATTTSGVITDAARIQDLHDAAMCAEAWVRADSWGEGNQGSIWDKTDALSEGWRLGVSPSFGIRAFVFAATANAEARTGLDEFTTDGKLHHVCMQFDDGGDRKIYLWVDGIPVSSYAYQPAANGLVVSDIGNNLYFGNISDGSRTWDGLFGGWARVSSVLRYTNGEAFVPDDPFNPPATDANTAWQTDFSDGAGCLIEGTRAFFGSGYLPVEDILDTDETILQSDGKFGQIQKLWQYDYDGEIVRLKARGMQNVGFTPDHKVLRVPRDVAEKEKIRARSIANVDIGKFVPEWVAAEEIRIGDYLLVPRPKLKEEDHTLEFGYGTYPYAKVRIYQEFDNGLTHKDLCEADYGVQDATLERYYHLWLKGDTACDRFFLNRSECLDEEWAEIFGWWVAEGSIRCQRGGAPSRAEFTFHPEEWDEAKRVRSLCEKKVGSIVRVWDKGHSLRVIVDSVGLAGFLVEHFGRGALNKRIPDWLMNAKKSIVLAFLRAYNDGDGCIKKRVGGGNPVIEMSTSSPALVSGVSLLLMKIGVLPQMPEHNKEGETIICGVHCRQHDSWGIRVTGEDDILLLYPGLPHNDKHIHTYLMDDNFFYARVSVVGREEYTGKVYDFTTETHSLGLPFVVHNSTLTDDSLGANNCTLSNYEWLNSYDQTVISPGSLIFGNQGYIIGSNGVSDGILETFTGLTPADDFVFRFVGHPGPDSNGQLNILVYDEIGAANITSFPLPWYTGVHTGANNSATLIAAAGTFSQRQIGACVWNITDGSFGPITAVSGDGTTVTATLAGGVESDWDTNDVFRITWSQTGSVGNPIDRYPFNEIFSIELPAGCTSISVRLEELGGSGEWFVHQVELLENELTNPSMEVGAGNPWLPTGWINDGLDAGDTQASSTGGAVIHSGSDCAQFNVGASDEGLRIDTALAADLFMSVGGWAYGDGGNSLRIYSRSGALDYLHYSTSARFVSGPVGAVWGHMGGVYRLGSATQEWICYATIGAAGNRYADDFYGIVLDAVSLTATAANEANSTEATGLRVDGYDNAPMPIPAGHIFATSGWVRINVTPRHDILDMDNFGNTLPHFFRLQGDATNFIRLRLNPANTLELTFNDGAGAHTGTWAAAGALVAGTTYLMEVQWDAAHMELRVDGVVRVNIVQPPSFATIPTQWYPGTTNAGANQIDATFAGP